MKIWQFQTTRNIEWKAFHAEGPNIDYLNSEQGPSKGSAIDELQFQTQPLEASAEIKEFPCFEHSAE